MSDFFHLAIAESAEGNSVAFAKTDAGSAFGNCDNASLDQLQNFRAQIERVLQGESRPFSDSDLTSFGTSLFDWSLTGEVRSLYDQLNHDSPTSIEITSRTGALLNIPWEYIKFPTSVFGPTANRSVVRVIPTTVFRKPTPKQSRKIKVLLAVAAPIDQGMISWVEVKQALEDAFTARFSMDISIEVISATTRKALAEAFTGKKYDVFHFLGHGEVKNGKTNLLFVDEQNRTDAISTQQLSALLTGQNLSLVVLSACNSASGNFESPHAVLAKSLVECGIPAVVASQVSLPESTVAAFTGVLYKTLLEAGNIDHAVSAARVQVNFELGTQNGPSLEWGIPVLYRRTNSGLLFKV